MPSPKQKKTSTPSSPKAPSKQSTKSRKPKKTTKPKISKATPKLDKPKKPTEPADENLNHLFKASAWSEFYERVVKQAFADLLNKRQVGDDFRIIQNLWF
jgi:hypothetical protein